VRFGLFLRRCVIAAFPACLFVLSVTVGTARATIHYEIAFAHPEQHLFHVTIQVPDVKGEVIVQMAAWNALYQIRDFSSHVQRVEASTDAGHIPIEKLDKQTWRASGSGTVTIRYATYWDEGGPFATQLNEEHAFINPAMVLMYVPERRSEDVNLSISDLPYDWLVEGESLRLMEEMSRARFSFAAANYDELADAPIESAKFLEKFQVPGTNPQVWAVVHGDDWSKQRVQEDLRRICAYETNLMGGAPFQRYVFIIHFGREATGMGGGMEHANSTAISVRSDDAFANVAAHEFFHLWNVKRIRPASLDPIDYTKEQYTRALWFAEGVTNTYASYTMVRTGLWSKAQFYEDLGEQINELEARSANRWQSAEQSSLDAWLEKYPLYNRPQESVSYYTKGQVLGVLLDILIRDRTQNEKSLDDVLRLMNEEFAKQHRTYRDSLDVRLTAEQVAGGSFDDFFRKYVSNAEPLPYVQVLALAGLELKTVQQKHPSVGFGVERDANGALVIHSINHGGAAEQAGLLAGDVITSWNNAAPPRNPERWALGQKKGSSVRIGIRRDDRSFTVDLRLSEVVESFYRVTEDRRAADKASHIREGLLLGATQPVATPIR
jgi:predicted metalloprotease with PDZ domain